MKKAILSLGLFSMMMLLTSFTTSEVITVSQDLDNTETGGKLWIGQNPKKPDFSNGIDVDVAHSVVNIESYKLLYSNTEIKKID